MHNEKREREEMKVKETQTPKRKVLGGLEKRKRGEEACLRIIVWCVRG
jgi:hypothetical protein